MWYLEFSAWKDTKTGCSLASGMQNKICSHTALVPGLGELLRLEL